jgi:large subunit ribosomal protein L20
MRVKRGVSTRAKHNKIRKATKGMTHSRTSGVKLGRQGVIKALQHAYRDRRNKKRTVRALWNARINAATRIHGVSYSVFMNGLKKASIALDRKSLSEIAISDPVAFAKIVKTVM